MALFNFLKRDKNLPKTVEVENEILPGDEFPKEIFAKGNEPHAYSGNYPANGEAKGIEAIYAFLQDNYERKGYNDALTIPDESNKTDNMKLIQFDLEILIQKVDTYYKDSIREIDFHVGSRTRAGLIDLVEELKTRKEMVMEHIVKVEEIKKDMLANTGMTQRIILSYQRGFMKGLSALTQSKIMNKKI